MKTLGYIGYWLVVIGAINWGLVGLGYFIDTNLNIVNILLGSMPVVEHVVYILVAASAVLMLSGCRCGRSSCPSCQAGE